MINFIVIIIINPIVCFDSTVYPRNNLKRVEITVYGKRKQSYGGEITTKVCNERLDNDTASLLP